MLNGRYSRLTAPVAASAPLLALTAPAVADEADANYHGTFDIAAFSCGETDVQAPVLSGVWNLNTHGKTGVVTMNVDYDGSHHLSFGMSGGAVATTDHGVVVTFGAAVATVSGDRFTWSTPVAPCTASHPYDHVTYGGAVDR